MNGIRCRTRDLTESGKYIHPIYGYIYFVPLTYPQISLPGGFLSTQTEDYPNG